MDLHRYLDGPQVLLPDMLAAREGRGLVQARLLETYKRTLVSFTLNIAGPVKVFPLSIWTFEEGVGRIRNLCATYGFPICHMEQLRQPTGYECFLVVDAPAEKVKKALLILEEEEPLGRLFDLDVLDEQGRKVSREDLGYSERTCLVCGSPVFLCSRSRAHTLETIQTTTCRIMEQAYRKSRGALAGRLAAMALLREVQTTPKPGLVDMANTGAHRDMTMETFEQSALALEPYFEEFYAYGEEMAPEGLLPGLREIGIRAEQAMRLATGGVNTHKGIIFSMGIVLSALSRFDGWREKPTLAALRDMCRQIAAPLAADFGTLSNGTHGEQLYHSHGIRGARGEALDGFPALFETGLPTLDAQLDRGAGWNEAGVVTLLHIMAKVEDSNAIARSTPERAARLREEVTRAIASEQDLMTYAARLDRELMEENISPGGSADILALSFFLRFLEENGYIE